MDRRTRVALRRNSLRAGASIILDVTVDVPLEFDPLQGVKGRSLKVTTVNNLPIVDGGDPVDVPNGQVELAAGDMTFTPDSAYEGAFAFYLTVSDGKSSRVKLVKGVVA